MQVALDATPLIGRRTGVGRYVDNLVRELATLPGIEVTLVPITLRGRRAVPRLAGVKVRSRPAPARLLRHGWLRGLPAFVELWSGSCDVFHGTNFVLPPRHKAAGVVTVHDLSYLRYPEAVAPDVLQFQQLVLRAVQSGAYVVTPSHSVADEVRAEYNLPTDRVRATPLGVAEVWFSAAAPDASTRRQLGLPDHYTLFVGTREPRKNLTTVLTAHARAWQGVPGTPELVLVGPPGWGPETRRQPGVVVFDHVPDDALRAIVAGAAAVLMPSRYEGFGLPVLEALAAGVAVIASDIPVLREVAQEQATYVGVSDVDGWAEALARVEERAGNPATRRARARSFTWADCAAATVEVYRDAVGAERRDRTTRS